MLLNRANYRQGNLTRAYDQGQGHGRCLRLHRITAPCSLLALARSLSHASLPSLHFASSLQLEKVKSPAWGCFGYTTTLIVTFLVWLLNLVIYCTIGIQVHSCLMCCLWPLDAAFFGCFLGDIRGRASKESSAVFHQDIQFNLLITLSDIGTSHSQVRRHYGIGNDAGFVEDCLTAGFCRACIVVQIATQIRGMQPQPGPHNQMNACTMGGAV